MGKCDIYSKIVHANMHVKQYMLYGKTFFKQNRFLIV